MIALNLSLELWLHERTDENRGRVIEEYRYLCVRAARKFVRCGLERADLEQVAAIGLIKAVDRFDPECGTPLESYAWPLMMGELMHFIRDHERMMRAPRRIYELDRRWGSAERALQIGMEREIKATDVARSIGASLSEQAEIEAYRKSATVLALELLPDGRAPAAYTMEPHVDRIALEASIATLSDLERQVLLAVYRHGASLGEVAQGMGYSRRHVSRLHRSAIAKLASDGVSHQLADGALLSLARLQ